MHESNYNKALQELGWEFTQANHVRNQWKYTGYVENRQDGYKVREATLAHDISYSLFKIEMNIEGDIEQMFEGILTSESEIALVMHQLRIRPMHKAETKIGWDWRDVTKVEVQFANEWSKYTDHVILKTFKASEQPIDPTIIAIDKFIAGKIKMLTKGLRSQCQTENELYISNLRLEIKTVEELKKIITYNT